MTTTRRKLKRRINKTKRNKVSVEIMQEPSMQEPSVQQPSIQEPSVQEPSIQEPSMQQPSIQEPSIQEPSIQEPSMQEPSMQEPSMQEPSIQEVSDQEDVINNIIGNTYEETINKIHQEEIPNIHMTTEWRIDLNTKENRIPAIVYLELHGIGHKALKKYTVDHLLDTMQHDERLSLAKQIKSHGFVANKPLEKHILQYFDFLTIKDGERTFLVLGNTCYDLNNNWSIVIIDDDDEMYRNRFFVEIDELSDIFGYIDNNGTFKINDNGRICSEKSTKTEMIAKMNDVLKLSGSNYWYDTSTARDKPRRNSDNLSHKAFCAVTELYMRKLNSERVNNKIWFLKPEQWKRLSHFIPAKNS